MIHFEGLWAQGKGTGNCSVQSEERRSPCQNLYLSIFCPERHRYQPEHLLSFHPLARPQNLCASVMLTTLFQESKITALKNCSTKVWQLVWHSFQHKQHIHPEWSIFITCETCVLIRDKTLSVHTCLVSAVFYLQLLHTVVALSFFCIHNCSFLFVCLFG